MFGNQNFSLFYSSRFNDHGRSRSDALRERVKSLEEKRDEARKYLNIAKKIMNEEYEDLEERRNEHEKNWENYEILRDNYNSRIHEIQNKIRKMRKKEREFSDKATKAYHSKGNRKNAPVYAEKRQKFADQCQEMSEEAHRLGCIVKDTRLRLIEESRELDRKFFDSAREEFLAAKAAYEEAEVELQRAEEELAELEDNENETTHEARGELALVGFGEGAPRTAIC